MIFRSWFTLAATMLPVAVAVNQKGQAGQQLRREAMSSSGNGKGGKKGGGSKEDAMLFDTVVIGSGLAGMTAATDLEANGHKVKVLEAQNRLGGRSYRVVNEETGQAFDVGGQWVGETHTELRNLLNELGIGIFKAPSPKSDDDFIIRYDGKRITGENGEFDVAVPMCTIPITALIADYPKGLFPYELPDDHPLRKYDDMTVGEVIRSLIGDDDPLATFGCGTMFTSILGSGGAPGAAIRGPYPASINTLSFLSFAWSEANSPEDEDIQGYLIHGGSGQIAPILAEKLEYPVELNDPVVSIHQSYNDDGTIIAKVGTAKGKEYYAKNVIFASSPYMSGRINYDPPLSWDRHHLNQHKPMGKAAKIVIEYSEKWWGDSGFSISSLPSMLSTCMDSSDPEEHNYVMVCLILSDQYDMFGRLDSAEERQEVVLKQLSEIYDDNEAAFNPISFIVGDWPANPYVQGCYSSYWPTQAWTRYGHKLLEPHGVVQWAGTESVNEWSGYLEGAIRSGQNAAANVLEGNIGELSLKVPSDDYGISFVPVLP